MITLNVTPVPKPRMTQSDRWNNRPCVQQYWNFKDEIREAMGSQAFPHPAHIIFILPMPQSWSQKKRRQFHGQPHQQKPDWDNLVKALTDAIFDEDSHLFDVRVTKLWGQEGQIIIRPMAALQTKTAS